jgi:type IV pilus assembly protein PilB
MTSAFVQDDAPLEAPATAPLATAAPEGGAELWTPDQPATEAVDLGQRLVDQQVLDAAQLSQARNVLKQTPGKRLTDILIGMGIDEVAVQTAVAEASGLPFVRVSPDQVDEKLLHRLDVAYCKENSVVPLHQAGTRIVVGVTDPRRLFMLDEVRQRLARPVKVVLVTAGDIAAVIEAFTEEQEADVAVDDIIADIAEDEVEVVETEEQDVDLEKQAGESPVIRFVNYLIYDAVKSGASDIHIEPQEKRLRIRYRIDGILFESMNPPSHMHAAIVSRLKIMANLDISERRLPQDGRIRIALHGRKLDLRLSTLPTGHGEKAVMRILDARSIQVSLEDLGMPENVLTIWRNQIDQPHGILLVTGPTGSGKSTTLYASLGKMDRNKLNISTVEDPIEYHLDGINQVQTHEKIGMSFAAALRSLLRQDPDVVMVGEVRDEDTARIAVQAALTGHLVLSTCTPTMPLRRSRA